jgi:hypothetical protein
VPGAFDHATFWTSYIPIIIFPLIYLANKLYSRPAWVRLDEMVSASLTLRPLPLADTVSVAGLLLGLARYRGRGGGREAAQELHHEDLGRHHVKRALASWELLGIIGGLGNLLALSAALEA